MKTSTTILTAVFTSLILIFSGNSYAQQNEGDYLSLKNLIVNYSSDTVCFFWEGKESSKGSFFVIERSFDNNRYEALKILASVPGRFSYSSYFADDCNPLQNEIYYRIKYIYENERELADFLLYQFKIIKGSQVEKPEVYLFPDKQLNKLSANY